MRTLTVQTADELVERWKRRAAKLGRITHSTPSDYELGQSYGYRAAAAELMALVAVTMELEAAHHGDPECCPNCDEPGDPGHHWLAEAEAYVCFGRDSEHLDENALMEWAQGRRP